MPNENTLLPPRDHNQPELADMLRDDHAELAARAKELIDAFERMPPTIGDDDTAGKYADQKSLVRAAIKTLGDKHKAAKEPHLTAGRIVDGFFKALGEPLDRVLKLILARETAYGEAKIKAEEERRAAEAKAAAEAAAIAQFDADVAAEIATTDLGLEAAIEAEKLAALAQAEFDAKAAIPLPKAADVARVRGDFGGLTTMRAEWVGELIDKRTLDLEALRPFFRLADLDYAIRQFVKGGGRELRGAKIYQRRKAV